jgi:hypothetical protein
VALVMAIVRNSETTATLIFLGQVATLTVNLHNLQ